MVDDINWLDSGIKYNIYDFEKYDALRSEVWQNIAVKKSEENNSHIMFMYVNKKTILIDQKIYDQVSTYSGCIRPRQIFNFQIEK